MDQVEAEKGSLPGDADQAEGERDSKGAREG
jgi:hypothetical protein